MHFNQMSMINNEEDEVLQAMMKNSEILGGFNDWGVYEDEPSIIAKERATKDMNMYEG